MWDDRQESRVIGIICLHRDRSSMNIYSYTTQPFDEYCFSPSACTLCRRKARTVSSFRPFKIITTEHGHTLISIGRYRQCTWRLYATA
jgi:hypothetical protein